MAAPEGVFFIPERSNERVRGFRRNFAMTDGFEGIEVDAYVLVTDRYLVVCDTMLCPEDAATMMQMILRRVGWPTGVSCQQPRRLGSCLGQRLLHW